MKEFHLTLGEYSDATYLQDGKYIVSHNGEHYSDRYIKNNQSHRDDGPAIILSNGTKKWYFNGEMHRLDGPAVIWSDGEKAYYIKDEWVLESEYPAAVERYLADQYLKDNNLEIIQ